MEGFLNFRITPWVRRVLTRFLAIIPAVLVIGIFGEGETTNCWWRAKSSSVCSSGLRFGH